MPNTNSYIILYLEIFCIILDQNSSSNIRNVAESDSFLIIKICDIADQLN